MFNPIKTCPTLPKELATILVSYRDKKINDAPDSIAKSALLKLFPNEEIIMNYEENKVFFYFNFILNGKESSTFRFNKHKETADALADFLKAICNK